MTTLLNGVQPSVAGAPRAVLRYHQVRQMTQRLCEPLVTEDYVVQSMPDVSPTKWHLAHTSWFFETFILKPNVPGYVPFDESFAYLFNSYYVAVGDRHCRQNRGLLSRPTVEEIYAYRRHVDQHMGDLLTQIAGTAREGVIAPLLEIGLHHEQQHQELMLTDIKHVFWVNPLRPAYVKETPRAGSASAVPPPRWIHFGPGMRTIGHGGNGFAFDNEGPRHTQYVAAFDLASRLTTNGEYRRFMDDGGYARPELWLSAGWATAQQEQWRAPLYWIEQDGTWLNHTLSGLRSVCDEEPVCHVSFFEADAYARWAGQQLASEFEWETAADEAVESMDGNFVEQGHYHPQALSGRSWRRETPTAAGDARDISPSPGTPDFGELSRAGEGRGEGRGGGLASGGAGQRNTDGSGDTGPAELHQMFGDVWEWTGSAYLGYPGYRPAPGALGEYNGKFMCNQFVLRGGSCATSRTHIRKTYRNFFAPDARWQFTGIRLARSL